ncbi:MAG TPA: EAL domain-containing protein [Terriglobia bacterium]|nr:EAL domain-containing protein [Terriglobia bacterium]
MKSTQSRPSIHDILASNGVCAHFQPILSARQKSIVGLEALTRGIAGIEAMSLGSALVDGRFIPPDTLFQMASEEGVVDRLEQLCQETAVRTFADLQNRPAGLVLFMNFEPSVVKDDFAAADRLYWLLRSAGIPTRNVAIEILESRIDDLPKLCNLFDRFRELGFLVVLDDVGAGHSNLNRIPLIKPDILKVDRGLVSNIDADYYKQETFKSLVGLSRRIGALIVAEGVETESEAIVSLELGADLLQGYFLSPAQELASFEDDILTDAARRATALARKFKGYMAGKINQRKLQHRRFNVLLNQLLCELTNAEASRFDQLLSQTITQYPSVECIYVLDEGGIQISDTVCNASIPRKESGVMFQPAPTGTDHSLKEYYYILMDVELQTFTTDPYVSLASGNLCRTISTVFRDAANNKMYVLCIDVSANDIARG